MPPRPPRFGPSPFAWRILPAQLAEAVAQEAALLHYAPTREPPRFDPDYGQLVVAGISGPRAAGHGPISDGLLERLYQALTPVVEAWSGCEVERTWGYGIRSYGRGSVLHLHRDRVDTHILSCIIHVEDRSDQPWPLDFIDHEGIHHRLVFRPGQVLLYESLCPHARLMPFQGEYYRNLYLHWRPRHWDPEPLRGLPCKYRSLEQCLAEWEAAPPVSAWAAPASPDPVPAPLGHSTTGVPAVASDGAEAAAGWSAPLASRGAASSSPGKALACGASQPSEGQIAASQGQESPLVSLPLRAWRLATELVQLYEIPQLASAEECRTLIGLIESSLQPSTVTHGPQDYRTSRTCHLGRLESPLVAQLDARLAALVGVDPACSEPLQGQCYDPGQYFRAHTDWFAPGTAEHEEHCRVGGQRTWTVMVYLNTVLEGGETCFPQVGRAYTPIRGFGLAWNNLQVDGSPNPHTLHEALPVREGRKWVITKWFRERPGRNS